MQKHNESNLIDEIWCKSMPKIELHAHLNGSIRSSTILELAKIKLPDKDIKPLLFPQNDKQTIKEVFSLFSIVVSLTNNLETIKRITIEMIEDFAEENVKYLEIRTTPKNDPSSGFTKKDYVEAVLESINKCSERGLDIKVALLLSIARFETPDDANETVDIAKDYMKKGVVGIDFSGNPLIDTFNQFIPAILNARKYGLKLALHYAESSNYTESKEILKIKPDRLGHGC